MMPGATIPTSTKARTAMIELAGPVTRPGEVP
jgi:hypothetical protein